MEEEKTQDQTSEETQEETSEETAGEKETPQEVKPEEEIDYKTKFTESQKEAIRLRKENEDLKKAPKEEISEEEQKIREILKKTGLEEKEAAIQATKEEEKNLDELEEVYGDFDRKKFKEYLDDNPSYNNEGNVDYHKTYKYFDKLGGIPESPKKNTPSSQRTSDTARKEPYDVKNKTMWEIAEDAKKEIPE